MTIWPFRIAALAATLSCGTISVGFDIPDKWHENKQFHKAKHLHNQLSFMSSYSVPVAKKRHSMGCRTCKMGTNDSPTLFIPDRKDDVGMRAVSLINGMAIAAYHKMNFGGALKKYKDPACHHIDCNTFFLPLFGPGGQFSVAQNYPMNHKFNTIPALRNWLDSANSTRGIRILLNDPYLGNNCKGRGFIGYHKYATSQFLDNLRLQTDLTLRPLKFFRGGPSVAIHVRRGDINETNKERWTPDKYYFDLVEILRTYLPHADIHVFSTTSEYWKHAYFNGYRDRNMTVHLDGDILTDWSHMMQADVFIMGKSAFSFIPAFMNKKCVVHQDFCYEPLHLWTNGTLILQNRSNILEHCLKVFGRLGGSIHHPHT